MFILLPPETTTTVYLNEDESPCYECIRYSNITTRCASRRLCKSLFDWGKSRAQGISWRFSQTRSEIHGWYIEKSVFSLFRPKIQRSERDLSAFECMLFPLLFRHFFVSSFLPLSSDRRPESMCVQSPAQERQEKEGQRLVNSSRGDLRVCPDRNAWVVIARTLPSLDFGCLCVPNICPTLTFSAPKTLSFILLERSVIVPGIIAYFKL